MSRALAIAVMDQLAEQTWLELRHYYDSKIRIDEDAITSHLLFSIVTRLKGTLLMQDGRKIESRTGADFDLWVASPDGTWVRFAIQAKRITIPTAGYPNLEHKVGKSGVLQHELLRKYAKANGARPLYLFYNHWDPSLAPGSRLRHAHLARRDRKYGCSVTTLQTAVIAMGTRGAKNYPWMSHQSTTRPWSCVLDPAAFKSSVPTAVAAAMASAVSGAASGGVRGSGTLRGGGGEVGGESEKPQSSGIDIDALIDSNVHDRLPTALQSRMNGPRIQTFASGDGFVTDVGLAPRAVLILGEPSVG